MGNIALLMCLLATVVTTHALFFDGKLDSFELFSVLRNIYCVQKCLLWLIQMMCRN